MQEAKFPRDFGVDTLAGILGVDPPSFGGRGRGRGRGGGGGGGAAAVEEERKLVLAFLEKWKAFDWTSELDGAEECLVGCSTEHRMHSHGGNESCLCASDELCCNVVVRGAPSLSCFGAKRQREEPSTESKL